MPVGTVRTIRALLDRLNAYNSEFPASVLAEVRKIMSEALGFDPGNIETHWVVSELALNHVEINVQVDVPYDHEDSGQRGSRMLRQIESMEARILELLQGYAEHFNLETVSVSPTRVFMGRFTMLMFKDGVLVDAVGDNATVIARVKELVAARSQE